MQLYNRNCSGPFDTDCGYSETETPLFHLGVARVTCDAPYSHPSHSGKQRKKRHAGGHPDVVGTSRTDWFYCRGNYSDGSFSGVVWDDVPECAPGNPSLGAFCFLLI